MGIDAQAKKVFFLFGPPQVPRIGEAFEIGP
jgi:hypothetical protein